MDCIIFLRATPLGRDSYTSVPHEQHRLARAWTTVARGFDNCVDFVLKNADTQYCRVRTIIAVSRTSRARREGIRRHALSSRRRRWSWCCTAVCRVKSCGSSPVSIKLITRRCIGACCKRCCGGPDRSGCHVWRRRLLQDLVEALWLPLLPPVAIICCPCPVPLAAPPPLQAAPHRKRRHQLYLQVI